MQALREVEYKGYTIGIHTDDDPQNPREWDNMGTMFCEHSRYTLGDPKAENPFDQDEETGKYFLKKEIALAIPLFLYDHSGISISARTFVGRAQHAEWDSGQVGVIYITHEKIKHEYGKDNAKNIERAKACLLSEVKTYDQYLRGDVYGYTITTPDGRDIGGCWGFYPDQEIVRGKDELADMIDQAEAEIEADIEEQKACEKMESEAFAL